MYTCELGHTSKPREPLVRVVTEARRREYVDDRTGTISHGWEVIKEVNLCPLHAKELTAKPE